MSGRYTQSYNLPLIADSHIQDRVIKITIPGLDTITERFVAPVRMTVAFPALDEIISEVFVFMPKEMLDDLITELQYARKVVYGDHETAT